MTEEMKNEQLDPLPVRYYRMLGELPNFVVNSQAKMSGRTNKGNSYNYSYKYMNLPRLLDGIEEPCRNNHLRIIQKTRVVSDNVMSIDTIAIGEEGETFEVGSYAVVITADFQAQGKQITYGRRYSLYCALGIFPEKDDDGASAYSQRGAIANDGGSKPYYISKQQGQTLVGMAQARGLDARQLIKNVTGKLVQYPTQVTVQQYPAVIKAIQQYQVVDGGQQ